MSPESHLLGREEILRWKRVLGLELREGWPVGWGGRGWGRWPQEGCVWPLVQFLLPKDWGYCPSTHGWPGVWNPTWPEAGSKQVSFE